MIIQQQPTNVSNSNNHQQSTNNNNQSIIVTGNTLLHSRIAEKAREYILNCIIELYVLSFTVLQGFFYFANYALPSLVSLRKVVLSVREVVIIYIALYQKGLYY